MLLTRFDEYDYYTVRERNESVWIFYVVGSGNDDVSNLPHSLGSVIRIGCLQLGLPFAVFTTYHPSYKVKLSSYGCKLLPSPTTYRIRTEGNQGVSSLLGEQRAGRDSSNPRTQTFFARCSSHSAYDLSNVQF